MATVVMDQAIKNRLHWYLSRYPNNIQGARIDAEEWALRYLEGIGAKITIEENERIKRIINQELNK